MKAKEREFADFLKNGVVNQMVVSRNERGKYEVDFSVSWRPEVYELVQLVGGRRRQWVSLDRLMNTVTVHCKDASALNVVIKL